MAPVILTRCESQSCSAVRSGLCYSTPHKAQTFRTLLIWTAAATLPLWLSIGSCPDRSKRMQPRNPDMLVHLLKTKWTGKKYAMNYAQTKSRNTFTKFTGRICIVMALLTAQSALAEPAGKESMIRNAKQILFLGDSITMDGRYVAAVDAWLTARYGANARVAVNAGLSSETVSGLTEEGHADGKFPRPYLHERLGRHIQTVRRRTLQKIPRRDHALARCSDKSRRADRLHHTCDV